MQVRIPLYVALFMPFVPTVGRFATQFQNLDAVIG
jgi:hypothetical protein